MDIVLKSNSDIAHSSKQLDTTNINFDDGVVLEILIAALNGTISKIERGRVIILCPKTLITHTGSYAE